jgi:hypothetical protein
MLLLSKDKQLTNRRTDEEIQAALHLEIGDRGKLNGVEWEVVGRLAYDDYELRHDIYSFKTFWRATLFGPEWTTFPTRSYDYLLRGPSNRRATLEVTLDGLVLVEPSTQAAPSSEIAGLSWGAGVFFLGRIYQSYKRGRSELAYQDGSVPWLAQTGDVSRFVDCIHQPSVLSANPTTRVSIEWPGTDDRPNSTADVKSTLGHHVSELEFTEAFPKAKPPACFQELLRPNKASLGLAKFGLASMSISVLAMLLAFVLSTVLTESLATHDTEASVFPTHTVSDAFKVSGNAALVRVDIDADVDTESADIHYELIEVAAYQRTGDASAALADDMPDNGDGRRAGSQTFGAPPAGLYQLRVTVEQGTQPVRVTARIQSTPFHARWVYLGGFLMFCAGGLLLRRRYTARKDLWSNQFAPYLTDDPAVLESIAEEHRKKVEFRKRYMPIDYTYWDL